MPSGRTLASLAALTLLAACAPPDGRGSGAAPDLSLKEEAYPPLGELIPVGPTFVHAFEAGPPDAPVVILIHGASGNVRDFAFDLTGRLADRYRVIAFDRPGLGHTPPLHGRGESPSEQAALLNAAAAKMGVERAVVVGHSFGGSVAMAWALEYPERVAGVVSLAGATMPWEGELGPWYRVVSSGLGGATFVPLVSTFATEGLVRGSIDATFAPQTAPTGYAEFIGAGLTLRPQTLRLNARQVNSLKPHLEAMAPLYATLDIPVEAVHGTADTSVPIAVHSEPMVALIPEARLTRLEGIGHMPHHARPDAAVAAIDRVAARAGQR